MKRHLVAFVRRNYLLLFWVLLIGGLAVNAVAQTTWLVAAVLATVLTVPFAIVGLTGLSAGYSAAHHSRREAQRIAHIEATRTRTRKELTR